MRIVNWTDETLESCPIDGDFDDCTENALLSFQNNYGLRATGALDSSTRDFINRTCTFYKILNIKAFQ